MKKNTKNTTGKRKNKLIYIDVHEPEFFRRKFPFAKVVDLPIGDFIVGDVDKTYVIERKEIMDFVNSIKSKRLWEQVKDLYCVRDDKTTPIFIVEGSYKKIKMFSQFSLKAVRAAELAVEVRWGIPLIKARNMEHTAEIIKWIHDHESRYGSPRIPDKSLREMSPEERKLWVLTSLPEMGIKKAEEVLKRFKTIKSFIDNIDKAVLIQGISERMVKMWKQILYE